MAQFVHRLALSVLDSTQALEFVELADICCRIRPFGSRELQPMVEDV